MSDIYGKLTEHPEYPIEDPRRYTVEIKRHTFEAPRKRRDETGHLIPDPFCARCGYHKDTAVHER